MKKKLLILGSVLIVLSFILGGLSFLLKPAPSEVDVKIRVKPAIMPIAYKVYGNPEALNGRFWLVKFCFKNKGPCTVRDFQISYRTPGYVDWTTPSVYREIVPGQTVIDRFYPKLPSKIMDVMNATPASVEIRYSYFDGQKKVNEIKKVSFQIRGRNEFIYTDLPPEEIADITDAYDNSELLAAFVTPEDPVIKYFTQQLQQKVLKGTVAGVSNNPQEIQRFMKALYDFEVRAGMVYAGTLGLPEKVGDSYSIIQHIRLPREVLTGGAGLCIELSTFFCSVAMSAGLQCGIFLTSKHAFPAIFANNTVIPIESTAIGGKGLGGVGSFEDALKAGLQNFQKWAAGGDSSIGVAIGFLNISKLQKQGIRPPELSDSESLRKKVDQLFEKTEIAGAEREAIRTESGERRQPGRRAARRYSTLELVRDSSGMIVLGVPRGWRPYQLPLPFVTLAYASPDLSSSVEVYVAPGYSPEGVLQEIQNLAFTIGSSMNYRVFGRKKINGITYKVFQGETVNPNGTIVYWKAYLTQLGNRAVGFSVGAIGTNPDSLSLLAKITNSFRVRS